MWSKRRESFLKLMSKNSIYQVWSRLEENGHINMRVLPSQIEFTLPSPKIGIETLPLVDPAWLPRSKTKLDNIDMRRRGTTIISATKVSV
jgi:hypothetical protein